MTDPFQMQIEKAEFLGTSKLQVELQDDGLWRLLAPLVFRSKILKRTVYAPIGFVTDFASVPRVPVAYLVAGGRVFKAAVLHDKALEEGMDRALAAELFLEAMEAENVPQALRTLMYAAVRLHDQSYKPAPENVIHGD